jgi:hypothetical protein
MDTSSKVKAITKTDIQDPARKKKPRMRLF